VSYTLGVVRQPRWEPEETSDLRSTILIALSRIHFIHRPLDSEDLGPAYMRSSRKRDRTSEKQLVGRMPPAAHPIIQCRT
jgi:hypothetical protein